MLAPRFSETLVFTSRQGVNFREDSNLQRVTGLVENVVVLSTHLCECNKLPRLTPRLT